MELRRESTDNFLKKLMDCKLCLLGSIHKPVQGYTVIMDAAMNHDSDVELVKKWKWHICTKNKHFTDSPMYFFCRDSLGIMVKLRKDCLKTKEFTFAYGCAPHAIHNLYMDLIKNFPGVKRILKQILYMLKTLKSLHLLLQLFNKLCPKKFNQKYVLIFFYKDSMGHCVLYC